MHKKDPKKNWHAVKLSLQGSFSWQHRKKKMSLSCCTFGTGTWWPVRPNTTSLVSGTTLGTWAREKKHREESSPYEIGYKYFCDTVVEEKLLKSIEIIRLSKLNMLFQEIIKKKREGIDISNYKANSLKGRLQKTHPFLRFQESSTTYLVWWSDSWGGHSWSYHHFLFLLIWRQ